MEEELKCRVCLGIFDQKEQRPRLLPCVHTVCESCLKTFIDMAVRGQQRPDDVVTLKCPECRHTQPLDNTDVNSFPINNKILETVSNRNAPPKDDDDDDLLQKFKHVSMDTRAKNPDAEPEDPFAHDPEQTRLLMPYGAGALASHASPNHRMDQVELGTRNMTREHNNFPSLDFPTESNQFDPWFEPFAAGNGQSVSNQFTDPMFLQNAVDDYDDMIDTDDIGYMNDLVANLELSSPDFQQPAEPEFIHCGPDSVAVQNEDEEEDVMAAIRRSCVEMYGAPVVSDDDDSNNGNNDLVADGAFAVANTKQNAARGMGIHARRFQPLGERTGRAIPGVAAERLDRHFPGSNGGAVGKPFLSRNDQHLPRFVPSRQRDFLRGKWHPKFEREVPVKREDYSTNVGRTINHLFHGKDYPIFGREVPVQKERHQRYGKETEEQAMLKQLQEASKKNPMAATVLEDIVKTNSVKELMKEYEKQQQNEASEGGACAAVYDDIASEDDVVKQLKKQADTNPTAAALVQEMEMVEKLKNRGHLLPAEKQSILDEALQASERNPENRGLVDDLLSSEAGVGNSKDDVLEELMRASAGNNQARKLLDEMLNRNNYNDSQIGAIGASTATPAATAAAAATTATTKWVGDGQPTSLIEEILRDKNASEEEKHQLVNEIAAKASATAEQDDTLSLLMAQAKDNPLAAQILHEMLSTGSYQ